MVLTREFSQTVVERVRRDPKFARALLNEAATLFLNGGYFYDFTEQLGALLLLCCVLRERWVLSLIVVR